jgi:proteasome lid subunit RPN8/RPN11
MKAERYALENELELLGIYHSHPDHPAIPSEHDFRQAVPFFSYIIMSVRHGSNKRLTSWRLNDDNKFEQERIIIEKPRLINT